jgi:hypothetical protein
MLRNPQFLLLETPIVPGFTRHATESPAITHSYSRSLSLKHSSAKNLPGTYKLFMEGDHFLGKDGSNE